MDHAGRSDGPPLEHVRSSYRQPARKSPLPESPEGYRTPLPPQSTGREPQTPGRLRERRWTRHHRPDSRSHGCPRQLGHDTAGKSSSQTGRLLIDPVGTPGARNGQAAPPPLSVWVGGTGVVGVGARQRRADCGRGDVGPWCRSGVAEIVVVDVGGRKHARLRPTERRMVCPPTGHRGRWWIAKTSPRSAPIANRHSRWSSDEGPGFHWGRVGHSSTSVPTATRSWGSLRDGPSSQSGRRPFSPPASDQDPEIAKFLGDLVSRGCGSGDELDPVGWDVRPSPAAPRCTSMLGG